MDKNMRVLYFVTGLNYKGGIARIVVDKANYLADKFNYEIGICTINGSTVSAYKISDKIKVFCLNGKSQQSDGIIQKGLNVIRNIRNTRNAIKKFKPDIVINAQTQIITWILPFICRNIPKIMEIHFSYIGMEYNISDKGKAFKKLYFKIAKAIYKRYNRFVILTEEDRQYWNLNNISVINNFTNFTTDRLSNLTNKRIICVARYHVQKRLDLLIEAWSKIANKHKDWKVEVFGMGPDKEKLQEQINKLNLQSSFILNDAVDDIRAEYLKSSIFALTSEHEGFVLVLLEAIIMGLPICMFDIVGTSWASNKGKTALVCNFGDTDSFSNNLSKLIENPDLRLNLRNEALKEMPKYNIDYVMSEWDTLIKQCIKN